MFIKRFVYLGWLAVCLGSVSACSDEELPVSLLENAEAVDTPEAWHDKTRTQPYPKLSNELYLNPPPLIVPQDLKTGERIQFALSQDDTFPEASTQLSEADRWCMFNPHRELAAGTWYWRYRNISADGMEEAWSEPVAFEVKAETPVFVTPDFRTFRDNVSRKDIAGKHPRLYCFLDSELSGARSRASSHDEYNMLISRAESAVTVDYDALLENVTENNLEQMSSYVEFLHQAYILTLRPSYASKLEELFEKLCGRGFSDSELFVSNFGSTALAYSILVPYDLLYERLDETRRQKAGEVLMRIARHYFALYCGMQENHIFDNHFWQKNMRILFQIAFCLFDRPEYAEEASYMLEYYYELWTARAPASGLNRDGAWINGSSYFEANVYTLYYMPMLLSYVAKSDFLRHPWYLQVGQALAYSWPPSSKSTGFGDGSENRDAPGRQRAAFADFIARETGDRFAGWYAGECREDMRRDVDMRIYRMCSSRNYSTLFPEDAPKMKWYKDIGEVVMHSDLSEASDNLTLAFRSSTFGSGSHTLADQNSFNLLYGGKEVYYHSGYYTAFDDAHNLMSYRHTRAHNTILVNGIGQAFSTEAYGMMLRANGGTHIAYALGDASQAYGGISNDPMWIQNFADAGIEQTPEYGFGETPLTKYRRQTLMLYPDIVLIYDELEASEPVRWDWLLHSPVQFGIDGDTFTTRAETGVAVARMFSDAAFEVSQTDQFVVSPGEGYANQWHLTAAFANSSACRILTVVQIKDSEGEILPVERNGSRITCGDWTIDVNLDPSSAERLQVTSGSVPAVYSYGSDNVQTGSGVYARQYRNSSVLYDEIDGQYQAVEQTDQSPVSSRRG